MSLGGRLQQLFGGGAAPIGPLGRRPQFPGHREWWNPGGPEGGGGLVRLDPASKADVMVNVRVDEGSLLKLIAAAVATSTGNLAARVGRMDSSAAPSGGIGHRREPLRSNNSPVASSASPSIGMTRRSSFWSAVRSPPIFAISARPARARKLA
jgi:hypothetical protein